MMQIFCSPARGLWLAGLLLLGGCVQPSPSGAKAVLVPVESELLLSLKTSGSRAAMADEAHAFITRELEAGAEKIEVLATGQDARWASEKLQQRLATHQRQIDYRHDEVALTRRGIAQLRIRVSRTELFMPACTPLSAADMWSAPPGCYVDRSRNKSLRRPSGLMPVTSELSKEQ